jgi:hypothetical protein
MTTTPETPVPGFYHEDGTACQERVCLRPHPLWESPAFREVQAKAESAGDAEEAEQ